MPKDPPDSAGTPAGSGRDTPAPSSSSGSSGSSAPLVLGMVRRGEALLDDLAQRSGETTRSRLRELLPLLVPILQSSVAAAVAFFVAHDIFGHPQPFFAPIAAVLSLGISLGHRLRRSVELVFGVALGVLIADLLAGVIGRGTWQIALFVALAMLIAVLVGGGPLIVNQGASSAILIATLAPTGNAGAFAVNRFIDALIGGLVGLIVNTVLLPLNPVVIARRAAGRVLGELADTLDAIAVALTARDADGMSEAYHRAVQLEGELDEFEHEVHAGREISRIAPMRWHLYGHLTQYVDAVTDIDSAVRNIRVLARRAAVMVRVGEDVDPRLSQAIRRLAESARVLRNELAKGVRPRAARIGIVHAAELATETVKGGQGFSANVVVAQIQSAALDLLMASGLERRDAEHVLRELRSPAS